MPSGLLSWPRRVEAFLDARGRGAWIAAMVLGFVVFWPVGLALVAYITVTKRWSNQTMFGHRCSSRRQSSQSWNGQGWGAGRAYATTGNSAFDAYRAETLRRLEEEQAAFESFLGRLREAKDKQEFDAFMNDRARAAQAEPKQGDTPPAN
ncbi:MAG: hypothetical protein CFE34_16985 [Rhodobacteraceae bacterium PARR1]|nr:MAG: hypothetical protein CFE34_16985 [Rhodobacteraceae bacterium PARR1]